MASMYWAITTMSTVGYGDITSYTEAEQILAIIWMLFGVCFFSFVIGSLSSMMSSTDSKAIDLKNKLKIIEDFTK